MNEPFNPEALEAAIIREDERLVEINDLNRDLVRAMTRHEHELCTEIMKVIAVLEADMDEARAIVAVQKARARREEAIAAIDGEPPPETS